MAEDTKQSTVKRWPRVILHADMDAFYASVEQQDRPELKGKPVIVGGTGNRGVVSAASYEARAFGVRSAMPTVEARRRCPQAEFLSPRFERYSEVSRVVMGVFDQYSPLVEPLSVDEAFLDMTGAEGLFGPPAEMGRRLRRDVREATEGLTVSVGVAGCKFVAKVASDQDKPDGLTVVEPWPETTHGFLWPLPVRRLWGVGPKTQARLEELGLRTIGDVAQASERLLAEHLGELGEHLRRLSLGEDDREVVPERETKSIGAEMTLDKDIVGPRAVRKHLRRAADRVAPRLRSEGLLAGGVRVKLKTAEFQLLTRQVTLPRATDEAKVLFEQACALLPQFELTVPMRLVGIAAYDLRPADEPVQGELFDDEGDPRAGLGSGARAGPGSRSRSGSGPRPGRENRRLERTLDELRDKFGKSAVKRGSDLV
ncbi:MAG: DNA polymerase IV [bacterium]